jgi:hypothetical protein
LAELVPSLYINNKIYPYIMYWRSSYPAFIQTRFTHI